MVSKGVIRERPRNAEEAKEFIKGERLFLSLLHANFRYAETETETETKCHIQVREVLQLLFVDRVLGRSSVRS